MVVDVACWRAGCWLPGHWIAGFTGCCCWDAPGQPLAAAVEDELVLWAMGCRWWGMEGSNGESAARPWPRNRLLEIRCRGLAASGLGFFQTCSSAFCNRLWLHPGSILIPRSLAPQSDGFLRLKMVAKPVSRRLAALATLDPDSPAPESACYFNLGPAVQWAHAVAGGRERSVDG